MGGFLYDVGADGSECRWARVLAYEPPTRVVLSWDISPQWQIESDLNKTSEWEVGFVAETASRARIKIERPRGACIWARPIGGETRPFGRRPSAPAP